MKKVKSTLNYVTQVAIAITGYHSNHYPSCTRICNQSNEKERQRMVET